MTHDDIIQRMLSQKDVEGLKESLADPDLPLDSIRNALDALGQIGTVDSMRVMVHLLSGSGSQNPGLQPDQPTFLRTHYLHQEIQDTLQEMGHKAVQLLAELYWDDGTNKSMRKDIVEILQRLWWQYGANSKLVVP